MNIYIYIYIPWAFVYSGRIAEYCFGFVRVLFQIGLEIIIDGDKTISELN